MKKLSFIFLGIMGILFCLCFSNKTQAETEKGRALFIFSEAYGSENIQLQIDGLKEGIGTDLLVDYVFMDRLNVSDEKSDALFYKEMQYSIQNTDDYDVIVVGGNGALEFVLEYRDELFYEIPIIFHTVTDLELAQKAAKDALISGIVKKDSLEQNIKLALALNPSLKKIVAVTDDSEESAAFREALPEVQSKYADIEFEEMDISTQNVYRIQKYLLDAKGNEMVLFVSMDRDATGRVFTMKEAVAEICNLSKVPVLSMTEEGMGEGFTGGSVISLEAAGMNAGRLARMAYLGIYDWMNVLQDSPNVIYLDEPKIDHFDLKYRSLLKDGQEVIWVNKKLNFFERNREIFPYLLGSTIAVLLLLAWEIRGNLRGRRLLKEAEEAKHIMETASKHDFLTGLGNRSKFVEDLEAAIKAGKPCTVVMIDIDHFKSINDTLGHAAGDETLKQLAARMKELHSRILTPYRYAGDEFIVILQSEQQRILDKAALDLSLIFDKPIKIGDEKLKTSGSMGVAVYPKDADNTKDLLFKADAAMYTVKQNGRGKIMFYEAGMEDSID